MTSTREERAARGIRARPSVPRPASTGALALLLALSLARPVPALAADASKEAEVSALAVKAQEQYQSGAYLESAETLLEAYALIPVPKLLYNAARAFEKAGDEARALTHFRKFLDSPGADPELMQRTAKAIAELEASRFRREAAAKEQALEAERRALAEEQARETKEAEARRRAREAAERKRRAEETASERTLAYVLLGAGALAAGGGAVLGVSALDSHDAWKDEPRLEDRRALASDGRRDALLADVSYGASAVLVGVGVWFLVGTLGDGEEPAP